MSQSVTIFATLVASFLGFSLVAAGIVAWAPSFAELISRYAISWRSLATLAVLFALIVPELPPSSRQYVTVATLGLMLLAIPISMGIFLFPRETRDAVEVRPEPAPESSTTLLRRLQTPWSSMATEYQPAALDLVRCAAAAYNTNDELKDAVCQLGFTDHSLLENGSAKAVVMIHGSEAVIAFEGTNGLDDIGDWFANLDKELDLMPEGQVHRGFLRAYNLLADRVRKTLEIRRVSHVWVTGHSLGGAMAVICASELQRQGKVQVRGVVTFGQPLLLAPTCARAVNESLEGRFLRFINEDDIVPCVAPGLRGGGSAVWFKGGKPKFCRPIMRTLSSDNGVAVFDDLEDDGPTPLTDSEFEDEKRRVRARTLPPKPGQPVKAQAMPNATDHKVQRYVDAIRTHFSPLQPPTAAHEDAAHANPK